MEHEDTITFTVPGEPKGKARPKFRSFGKFTMAYTPKSTVEYEDKIRRCFKETVGDDFKPIEGPIEANALCVFSVPSHVSESKKNKLIGQPVLKKPDTDNIIKSILDPLNKIAYHDDSQVCKLSGLKIYGDSPRVDITIKPYENNIITPIRILSPSSKEYKEIKKELEENT